MLHLIYLSFHEHAGEEGQGNISCVVDAETVEDAAEKTATLIERLHADSETFQGIKELYLDEIVQIRSLPDGGFLSHWQWAAGTDSETVSAVLPGVDEEHCEAFSPIPEGSSEDDEDGVTAEPFLLFE